MNKNNTVKWMVSLSLVLIFSFFMGYYLCYRINEREKSKLDIIREIMENEWYYGIDDENIEATLQDKMILGALDLEKDPYTLYLDSLGSLADTYTGLGISVISYGEYFIISDVSSKTSIDDGVKTGDVIISINGVDIKNKKAEELKDIIGSGNVILKVLRNNTEVLINTRVTSYEPVTVFSDEHGDDITYVKISEFNLDTASHLESYFSNLPASYTKLILDLRGNPGGYVSAVNEVLDLFVTSGKVSMTTINKHGDKEVVKTVDDGCYLFNSIYVLIDDDSASGAEALSAALNYHLDSIVTLYGEKTYGKGSAQKTYTFSDGTYFHYTYALWYTPEGITINHEGVKPEIYRVNTGISSVDLYQKELSLYDYGTEVKAIQQILVKLGYYDETKVHSFMDENTVKAIKAFQSYNGLTVNGKIDMATLRYMSKLLYDDKVNFDNETLNIVLGVLS